jgi:hypothetical protein
VALLGNAANGIGKYVVFQEDALNTWDTGGEAPHAGLPVQEPRRLARPHAYIVTTEEAPFSVGPDYNDVVYVVRNVKPASSGGGGALQLINGTAPSATG